MSKIAVSVNNLTKIFGDFVAVSDISFNVHEGEIFGFLGANGAGKSTTIKMLCGIIQPSQGTGSIVGFDINNDAVKIRQHIGYMSQKFSLYDELTVVENLNFFAKLYSVQNNNFRKKIDEILELVSLNEYRKEITVSLSSGIKQRLSLACAIIHNPKVIFLDEPTSGIDPISRRNFWNLIYSFAEKNITIFVTTHYMDEAEYCDRIALVNMGKLKSIGTPIELKTAKMSYSIFEIKSCGLQIVANIFKENKQIFDVGILSDSIRVLTKDLTLNDIKIILSNSKIVADITKVEASLEDVFVASAKAE